MNSHNTTTYPALSGKPDTKSILARFIVKATSLHDRIDTLGHAAGDGPAVAEIDELGGGRGDSLPFTGVRECRGAEQE